MKNQAYIFWILKNKMPKCLIRYLMNKFIPNYNWSHEIQYVHLEISYLSLLYRESIIYESFLQFCVRQKKKYISISDKKFKRKFPTRKKTISEIIEATERRKIYKKKMIREYRLFNPKFEF